MKGLTKFILIFTLVHFLLSILLMFVSFGLVMERSAERDQGLYRQPTLLENAVYSTFNTLMRPLAYCNPATGGCNNHWIDTLLPGVLSWIIVPLNSFLWAIVIAGVIKVVKTYKKRTVATVNLR